MDDPMTEPNVFSVGSQSHATAMREWTAAIDSVASSPHRRRGRPPRNSLGQRNKRLLETARRLFLAHGVQAVPLAEIARHAGVALRTIYLQYGGKRGLLEAIVKEVDDQHRLELAELALEGRPWYDQLARLADHVAARFEKRELMRLCDIVMESNDARLIAAFEAAGPCRVKQALGAPLSLIIGASRVRGLHSVDDLCDYFITCMGGMRLRTDGGSGGIEARARRGLDLFMHALPTSCRSFPTAR